MSSQQLLPPINQEEDTLRQERRDARADRRRQRRRAQVILWGTIGTSVLLLGVMSFIFFQVQKTVAVNTLFPPINGVTCDSAEQSGYHIHIHLTIYINGKFVTIPTGIGIGIAPDKSQNCFYWMHTHTDDGIIHIEAPGKVHNVALDDFMAIWHDGFAKLNFPPEILQTTGWKIFVNGQPFGGVVTSPMTTEVTLSSHDVITLEYGKPNPPPDKFFAFPANLPK